jgi:hypothetical protein
MGTCLEAKILAKGHLNVRILASINVSITKIHDGANANIRPIQKKFSSHKRVNVSIN